MKNRSAWYDNDVLPQEMLKGARCEIPGWSRLEHSAHFRSLRQLMNKIPNGSKVLELGCGAAEFGRVFKRLEYTGADLPHIVEGVSKVMHPEFSFIPFDAYESDMSFVKEFDVVVMNAFLSELENPIEFLRKLFIAETNTVVIHRQSLSETSRLEVWDTYGGLKSTNSFLGKKELDDFLLETGYFIDISIPSGTADQVSLIIRKKT